MISVSSRHGMPFSPFILLLLFTQGGFGAGFSINPWIIFLEPDKNKMSQELTLHYVEGPETQLHGPRESKFAQPVPVELKVVHREVDIDGKVNNFLDQVSEDFVIFPSQIILYPGDVQKVQLQWVGTSLPKFEKTYGLIAEQIAVDIPDEGGAPVRGVVNILVRYEAVVVVTPKGVKPLVKVDTTYRVAGNNGPDSLFLQFSNPGTARQSLGECRITLSPRDGAGNLDLKKNVVLSPTALEFPVLKQALFAGGKRNLKFAWPENLPKGKVSAAVACALEK